MSLMSITQAVGRLVRPMLQFEQGEQFQCIAMNFVLLAAITVRAQECVGEPMTGPQLARQANVVQNVESRKQPDVLKRPRDSRLRNVVRGESDQRTRIQRHPTAHRSIDSRQQIEDSRLASAIGADQTVKRSARNLNGKILNRLEAAKGNAYVLDVQQRISHRIAPELIASAKNPRFRGCRTNPEDARASFQ